ncbi:hypothetical protein CROQUDRAFT_284390 [Cronartium quercuum f. sp. fusiforme G11]|uniref:Aquaporin n=1 Tax=Cronartium quercuum f. sp. fusiforme G11 TaxID=708437 RepID=A0A9P6T7G7_9BASI|nr:hypothetical protein CROQUDRAFT_284390 [Cronartium quercuum f. sp. fusiforme G11]
MQPLYFNQNAGSPSTLLPDNPRDHTLASFPRPLRPRRSSTIIDFNRARSFSTSQEPKFSGQSTTLGQTMMTSTSLVPQNLNLVSRFRGATKEYWAEFFGTATLVMFGTGVNHQVKLGGNPSISSSNIGDFLAVAIGWGIGITMGVYLTTGISEGHINPAITLAQAVFRGFSWKKVPLYWLAQLCGAFFGASLVYINYQSAISVFEGGSGIRNIRVTGGMYFTCLFFVDQLKGYPY